MNSSAPENAPVSYHNHKGNWRWTGPAEGGDWTDPNNWTLFDDNGVPVSKDNIPTGYGTAIPQSYQDADTNIGAVGDTNPNTIVLNAASYNQLRSLSIWENGTLKITAAETPNKGTVFSTAGFENYGQMIIDTNGTVKLGGVSKQAGTLTIANNKNNVIFEDNKINNGGTINLINATLGSESAPVDISGGTINLANNSVLVAKVEHQSLNINVDPASTNTLYLTGSHDHTSISGISGNTMFGLPSGSARPVSADYSQNPDGSYSLVITDINGQVTKFDSLHMAEGYVPPQHATIVQDASRGWIIEDTTPSSASYNDTEEHKHIAQIVQESHDVGGDSSNYNNQPHSYHNQFGNWRWTGPQAGGDWANPDNWTLYDDRGNPVPTSSIPTGYGTAIPQSFQDADTNIGTSGGTTPITIVTNAPDYNQIRSLSVWENGTLEITAAKTPTNGTVFSTAGFENFGKIIIDTAGKVDLGGVNNQAGSLIIKNNNNNVAFETNRINNGGTVGLVNSTLGSSDRPITISGGTVTLSNSTLYAKTDDRPTTINLDETTPNTLYLSESSSNTVINGFSDQTRFGLLPSSSQPKSAEFIRNDDGSYTLLVTTESGRKFSFPHINMKKGYAPAHNATFQPDGHNGWYIESASTAPCFLTGVLINTPEGELPVESLTPGMTLIAYVDGQATERTITWVGQASKTVNQTLPVAEAGYPVRVLKNAFADNVPSRDLLITSEHCLFVDNAFIPARMLVNGRSILFDQTVTTYDFFHVETEQHSVIMSDGMLSESYLDTGNRSGFLHDGNIVSLGKKQDWSTDAAAPLTTDRATVEPLFHTLAERAETLDIGVAVSRQEKPTTTNPDLHLLTDTGLVIRQTRATHDQCVFLVPAGVRSVHLLSQTFRPSDAIGPFVDDRRNLGILAGDIMLFSGYSTREITAHLTSETLSGWDCQEAIKGRWTNGNAFLPLNDSITLEPQILSIRVLATGTYDLENQAANAA